VTVCPVFRDAMPERYPRLGLPRAPRMLSCSHLVYGRASACALDTTHYEHSTLCSRSYLRAIIGLFIDPRWGTLFPDYDAVEYTMDA
jgi:hypothetical protein